MCLVGLNEWFHQEAFSVLSNVETALINVVNSLDFDFNNVVKHIYKDNFDLEQLKIKLKLLKGIINHPLPEVKVTLIDTITSLFSTDQEVSQVNLALSNVVRLLQIYLLAPTSAASGE